MKDLVAILPHVNATLNAVATLLLALGYVLIRQKRERAHQWAMLSAFGVSVLFLASYVTYHGSLRSLAMSPRLFPASEPAAIRYSYYAMLISHIVLAATVPVLACLTIWYAYRDQRIRHRRLARWTFPIWMYVSVTGVLIYVVLYQVYGP